jgi:transcriptional regulator with PAS, ATPase and Fis domain
MSAPNLTYTAEELVKFYASCDDSVTLIDGVIAGTWINNNYATATQAQKNDMVGRNVESLEWRMSIDAVIADSTSKTPYINAIAAGKAYIANNS